MENHIGNNNHDHETKPIGAKVNVDLWHQVKIQAIRENRKTGEILDDAIRLYLKTKIDEHPA